jgi:cold shock CspA family protein
MSTNSETVPSRFTGRVKWFNNKTGYGFITVTSRDAGEFLNLDVFVHHSAVVVSGQQYKYLVQGEYVEFQLSEMTSGQHKYQVLHVSGIDGGKLMCETRNENQDFREPRETREPREHREPREPREHREPREPREHREPREPREHREPREPKEEPADWSRVNRHVSEDRGRGAGRGLGRGAGRGLGRGAGRGLGRGAGRSSSTHADV